MYTRNDLLVIIAETDAAGDPSIYNGLKCRIVETLETPLPAGDVVVKVIASKQTLADRALETFGITAAPADMEQTLIVNSKRDIIRIGQ